MKNKLIHLNEKELKTFAFTETEILFSSKKHDSLESLLASKTKSGMLETFLTIPVEKLNNIGYNEANESLKFKYLNAKGKQKSRSLDLRDPAIRDQVANDIAEMKGLQKNITEESKTKPLLINLGIAAVTGFFTVVMSGAAREMAEGKEIDVSGRRSGIKQLMLTISDFLGPTGVLIVGGLITVGILYSAYKRYSNPTNEISFN